MKKDLVGFGESDDFPYPIKLTYDDENIYLTPLYIPENLKDQYESGYIWLCLEVGRSRKNINWRNNIYCHPTKSGNFYVPGDETGNVFHRDDFCRDDFVVNPFELNTTYTFPYPPSKNEFIPTPETGNVDIDGNPEYEIPFVKVRGVYRISRSTSQWVSRIPGNTHSNICKIYSDYYQY